MNAAVKSAYPKSESGYFHLTPDGWMRKDDKPFPENRLETWRYDMECATDADKEQVHLARVWVSDTPSAQLDATRKRFGDAIPPAHDRHIVIDCRQ